MKGSNHAALRKWYVKGTLVTRLNAIKLCDRNAQTFLHVS